MSNDWVLFRNEHNPTIELKNRYNNWYQVLYRADGTIKYSKVNVSFGVAEYYFDYSF